MNIELCRKFFVSRRNCTLFTGFSGGADSTALLLTALHFKEEYGLKIHAVHFDHHLRGTESDEDVLFCREFAKKHNIPLSVIDLDLETGNGIEERARSARLAHWKKLAGNKKDCAVLLGHHGDDRMENFLLRMLRGSNLSGLLSPKTECCIDGVVFLRPLLGFSRKEIEDFLISNNISTWRNDSTNLVPDCGRNILRLQILPALSRLFPGAAAGMGYCLDALDADADYIEKSAQDHFDLQKINERSYWQSLHPALATRIIRLWTGEIPARSFLLALNKELCLPPPDEARCLPFSGSMELICQGDKLFWREPLPSSAAEWDWTKESVFTFGNWCFEAVPTDHTGVSSKFEAVFDGETLGNLLIAAPPLPGEQMLAFGRQEPVKVKKLRIDGKIPAYYALPVIKNSRGDIVWYPGVKHSAAAPVTEATEKMIRLRAFSPKFRIGVGID